MYEDENNCRLAVISLYIMYDNTGDDNTGDGSVC